VFGVTVDWANLAFFIIHYQPSESIQILSKTISNTSTGSSYGFVINEEGFQPSE